MNEGQETTLPRTCKTTDWIQERERRRWVRFYLPAGVTTSGTRGPVAAVVQESITPAQRREVPEPGGVIVSVYRPGKGEGRVATTGNASKSERRRRMADAILAYLATETG